MAQLQITNLKGNTYLIPSPTNVGVYVDNDSAILIDSGNDKEAGRQINRLLNLQSWNLQLIINTHSNADHIGGNAFLQEKTGCKIAATRKEAAFINDPLLEPAFLYGGLPNKDLNNKFLMAKPSTVNEVISSSGEILGTGLKAEPLPGHFFDMIGIMTPDNVFFIADSLFPESVINKYHLFYLLDIRSHFETLDKLSNIEADLFVPSHGEPSSNLDSIIRANKNKVEEILSKVLCICEDAVTIDDILMQICSIYQVSLNATQYVLLSNTIRSYLTYLYEEDLIECSFEGGKLTWKKK